jgi:hypothetical protein
MSLQKKKQIAEFSSKSADEKQAAISHPESTAYNATLYDKAESLRANLYMWCYFLGKDREASRPDNNSVAHLNAYIGQLLNYFLAAYKKKDGSFFRALADALERQGNAKWSKREKFIFAVCRSSIFMKESLPTASQVLKGWKINCGIMPKRRQDLAFLWERLCPNKPPPANIQEMQKKLRRLLPVENKNLGDIQITQIQREAKNVGYILPKSPMGNTGYLPPVGISAWVNERDNLVF